MRESCAIGAGLLGATTEPTEGQAQMYGPVDSMLAAGTGFHTELTGWIV